MGQGKEEGPSRSGARVADDSSVSSKSSSRFIVATDIGPGLGADLFWDQTVNPDCLSPYE